MPRSEHRSTPKVLGTVLYSDDGSLTVGSPAWCFWVQSPRTFYYESNVCSFTARAERRGSGLYWYAYRRRDGKLYKRYIGMPPELTLDRLHQVAVALADAV